MPRLRIIVLDRPDRENQNEYRVVFWADVPAERAPLYADASKVSAWKDATGTDLTALRSGAVVERVGALNVPAGWTLAQIQAEAETRWQRFQNEITAANPWRRYGTTWDGTTWTAGGVN